MKSNEIDEKKTKYFVIAIILLIVLSVILIVHFNNKSLVSGEEKITTTTTTTTSDIIKIEKDKKPVNKKEETKVETLEQENVIYKSTVDEINNLIYNYKLTDEINEKDIIVSKILTIDETLKNSNIIGLYDISLYDESMVKKNVLNSTIDISIPLTENLKGFDEYKVVYIDEENNIKEEFKYTIENNYIKFRTTHLSKFAIMGIKKEIQKEEIETPTEEIIDISNITLDLKINDILITDTNLYVSTTDKVEVIINNLDKEYKVYYLLKDEENKNTYQEFTNKLFESVTTPSKYTLFIKIDVDGITKTFEFGTVNIYDIVFTYDKDEVLEDDFELGTIKDENGVESNYVEKNTNKNIVIDVTEQEEVLEEDDKLQNSAEEPVTEETELLEPTIEETEQSNVENNEEENLTEGTEEEKEDITAINLKGNIYVVEKTDITNLIITGHLIIDTNEDVTYDKNLTTNIYTITIKSKEFSLNGNKYNYEYINGKIEIKKVAELEINNTVVDKETFEDLFNGYHYDDTKEELMLETYSN